MEWFILSRDLHVLCVPSSDSKDSLPIFNDKQTIVLQNNTVVSTYDFSVQQKHPDATNLKWGNYVVFRDKYGKTRMYTLISHDGDDLTQTWHAEDIGLDLLNETADKWDYTGESRGIDWYFNSLVLADTGWSIGINEISNLTRGLKFDGQADTQLKRLGDIANQFDGAEIDFEVALVGSRVTKQVVNIYKKVGNPMTQQRFVDSVNLKSLQSSGSIADLCTAMIGYGSQPDAQDGQDSQNIPPIDFSELSYDDGQFFSPKGDKAVYDRVNHLIWSRYSGFDTTNQNETKGYITGIYNYETKDPNELLNRTITQLKKRNAPSETYEANLLDINADIGDEVQIAHNNYNPPIYLSARVESVTNCYTASGQDTGILGDYQKLESQIDPRIKEMIDQLADQIKPNYTWIRYAKDDKGTGMTSRPTADTKYVAIVSNKPTGVPSDNPADYAGHWQLIKGNDGKDGIPGATGADGKTSYTHFAYANNVSGTADFSLDDPTGRSYMGVYSDFTKADSTNPDDYIWSLTKGSDGKDGVQGLQGADGKDGIPGKPGTDGKTPYFHTAWADSADGKINFSLTDATNRGYLGTYTDFTKADSTDPSKYSWVELVGNLVIGGRNYFAESEDVWTSVSKGGENENSSNAVLPITVGDTNGMNLDLSSSLTVSYDYEITGDNASGSLGLGFNVSPWEYVAKFDLAGKPKKGRMSATIKIADSQQLLTAPATCGRVRMFNIPADTTIHITHAKLDKSNKPSDWSPAPEDTQGQIDKVNNGLAKVDKEIAAVTKVDSQAAAPTNPKKGDQWWVKDANGEINGLNIWDGTKWAPSTITQSLLVIKELDAVNINGSVINGSKFTNNFDFKNLSGVQYQGVTNISDGGISITYKIPSTGETGTTTLTAESYKQIRYDRNGSMIGTSVLNPNNLALSRGGNGGYLQPDDLIRFGPEEWYNSDTSGNRYTMRFERRWGRVWVSGEFILPAAKFGTRGNGYKTLFTLKTAGLRPKVNRYISGIKVGDVPSLGMLEVRPGGTVVAIGVPNAGRASFEGISFAVD
ncbi:phage tail spike protein [Latilactobacillus fuchuensis]|uniref:phage tail spike protein n=1 Tax=Latilactobacillus fuchuensis TaxID=164393 RepID=UPI0039B093B9